MDKRLDNSETDLYVQIQPWAGKRMLECISRLDEGAGLMRIASQHDTDVFR
jgi:hypothetical protein